LCNKAEFQGKVVLVTGAASGIGAALGRALSEEGARVAFVDQDADAATQIAAEAGGMAVHVDIGSESGVQLAIHQTTESLGPIDICVSNAGLGRGEPSHVASALDEVWDLNWRVHVMAHVWAARALLPGMIERRSGYFINVASAAGLLNQIGDAAYSATKHAAVSFADSLAIRHAEDGIGVSVVCPQYVATPLINLTESDAAQYDSLLTADDVARTVIKAVKRRQFLILPHP
jgi:NAD(P)-dependent dehydrogenase (short-subunit alcohol dehydrogenase family)